MDISNKRSYFPMEVYLKNEKENKERHVSLIWKISDFDMVLNKAKEITSHEPSYNILGIHSENYTMAHIEINKHSLDTQLSQIKPTDIVRIMNELAHPSYQKIIHDALLESKEKTYVTTMTDIERIIDISQTFTQYLEFVHIFYRHYN